ncbi:MAG: PEGA domain-containing protein [bacterium]|nr:PEGA domain-containing protein [bacterium]
MGRPKRLESVFGWARREWVILLGALSLALPSGCTTKRVLAIESSPPGAIVRLDEKVIGRTPLEHPFQHYGQRRVTLYLPGYRTWSESIDFAPPWHARFPLDVVTQVILPLGLDDRQALDIELSPDDGVRGDPDLEAFIQRAQERRRRELRRRERDAERAESGPPPTAEETP